MTGCQWASCCESSFRYIPQKSAPISIPVYDAIVRPAWREGVNSYAFQKHITSARISHGSTFHGVPTAVVVMTAEMYKQRRTREGAGKKVNSLNQEYQTVNRVPWEEERS